ncbi:MAG: twin-arginine translocase subunit TatC [Helicobacteraceae bacterium]|jgi:sec-independent protein translocase protein TatC|nr:twin-arginine translocase subunit TatC [Helicobacteraceae bacterium]
MLEDLKPHIAELRSRLIKIVAALLIGFFICFAFWQPILEWISQPLKDALSENGNVIAYKMGEQFLTAVLVSFFAALLLCLPIVFYQIWAFVAPGLYASEKRFAAPFVICATIMFLLGAAFAYYVVFPYGFKYLVNFGENIVTSMISIGEYLSFFLKLIFGFGLSFELPVVCFFLAKIGLIDDESLKGFFRYAVVIIFIIAAILTPPDVLTQFLMAVPMILLYAVSILIARIVNPANHADKETQS